MPILKQRNRGTKKNRSKARPNPAEQIKFWGSVLSLGVAPNRLGSTAPRH